MLDIPFYTDVLNKYMQSTKEIISKTSTNTPFLQSVQWAPYNIVPHKLPSMASWDTAYPSEHLGWEQSQIFDGLPLLFLPLLTPWFYYEAM